MLNFHKNIEKDSNANSLVFLSVFVKRIAKKVIVFIFYERIELRKKKSGIMQQEVPSIPLTV